MDEQMITADDKGEVIELDPIRSLASVKWASGIREVNKADLRTVQSTWTLGEYTTVHVERRKVRCGTPSPTEHGRVGISDRKLRAIDKKLTQLVARGQAGELLDPRGSLD